MSILVALLALQAAAVYQTASTPSACQSGASCNDSREDSDVMIQGRTHIARSAGADKERLVNEEEDAEQEEDLMNIEEEEGADEEDPAQGEGEGEGEGDGEGEGEGEGEGDGDVGFELKVDKKEDGKWSKIKAEFGKIGVHMSEVNWRDVTFEDKDGKCNPEAGTCDLPYIMKYTHKKAVPCSKEQKEKPIYISSFKCCKNVEFNAGVNQKYVYVGDTKDGRPYYKSTTGRTRYLYYDRAGQKCMRGPRWILSKLPGKKDFTKVERIYSGCSIDASFRTKDQCAPMGKQLMQWQYCGRNERKTRPKGGYWKEHSVTLSNTDQENELADQCNVE